MLSVSLQIDKDSSRPLHLQVSDAMEKAIADGAFRGSKLPSVRGLAQRLKISPATVTAAYRTLVSRRLVEASPRSGFVVSAESQALKTPEVFALDKLQPNLRMHPVAEFGRLIAEVAAREIDSGGYEDFRGNKKLRERLAELGEESGVAADPSMEIFITEGCQQALALTAQIMGPGAKVAIANRDLNKR